MKYKIMKENYKRWIPFTGGLLANLFDGLLVLALVACIVGLVAL